MSDWRKRLKIWWLRRRVRRHQRRLDRMRSWECAKCGASGMELDVVLARAAHRQHDMERHGVRAHGAPRGTG